MTICVANTVRAIDHATILKNGEKTFVSGEVLTETQKGGILLIAADGSLWGVPAEELVERTSDPVPFEYYDQDERGKQLLSELPDGFKIHKTAHYVVAY
ncbi:MAG: hypothetical protein NXI22_00435, partial [bacterium]|nr:hypothetical protein [bacterium]